MLDARVNPADSVGATSVSLLRRAQEQSPVAWERIVALYGPLVYSWCQRKRFTTHDAEEIFQEVFLAASRSLASFQPDGQPCSFRRWLRVITQNKMRDVWERQRLPQAIGGSDAHQLAKGIADPAWDDDEEAIPASLETTLLCTRAWELIRSDFPNWYAEAFLRLVDGRESAGEIAASLGKQVGAVYNARSRIRKRLREEFEHLIELD